MSRLRRRSTSAARGGTKADFWLSFSDLMSVLVLVFILVMFYILYRYFGIYTAYQEKLNDMLILERALDAKQTELDTATGALAQRESELTDAQKELAEQQLLLQLAQEAMALSEEELSSKQEELDDALALLAERESAVSALEEQIGEQQRQLEALVGVRTRIIRDLSGTLSEAGITAQVDQATGSIMLESDVLFNYGSSVLSSQGKAYVDEFLPLYLSVLFSGDYTGYVSEIIIEGHTDTNGTYLRNLRLSQERAYGVAAYILEESGSLTGTQRTQLKQMLTANGRSYSDPIVDEAGNVDADASRRVVFKFRLIDEQMIESLQKILEGPRD